MHRRVRARLRLAELREREALDAIRPELDGNEVMAELDLRPGRDVGRALEHLLEIRLEEGLIGKEAARQRLRAWWAASAVLDGAALPRRCSPHACRSARERDAWRAPAEAQAPG